jgi:single-stranded-DNA-specific exonuclease
VSAIAAIEPASGTAPRKRWIYPEADPAAAAELAHSASIPLIVAELLLARGLQSSEEVARFLNPQLSDLHDPYRMRGMSVAVSRIQQAIEHREPILIYGDYDVDGTTATVLLKTAIEMLGGEARFHIPHRLREGYGMRDERLADAAAEGIRLVISVDTGIRAFTAAEAAEALGLDLIVTDHHLPEESIPRALAVLNPNQPDCAYPCKHLCGAGVAFKLAQALLEAHDAERARTKILPSFLKILAIATVADAVPLLGENRVFVALGLDGLRRPVNAGLRHLIQTANLDPPHRRLTPTDIAFRIAPRINAAGRMDIASDIVELFTTRQPQRAQELAAKLERLNTERRATEAEILSQIEARLHDPAFQQARCIVMDGDGWHRGILGILASRIVEQTGKPAVVITHEGPGVPPSIASDTGTMEGGARTQRTAYGSGRSISGFHLLNAIESCHDLFTRFGGHAHAVGFSLPSEKVPELRQRLEAYALANLAEDAIGIPLTIQALLPLDRITPALFTWLRRMEPCGMGNEEPVFAAQNVRVAASPRFFKDRHVRLQLAQGPRAIMFPAVGWNWAERVQTMGLQEGSVIHLAYKLRENEHPEFGGLELEISDIEFAH